MKHKLPLLLASLAMAFSVGTGIATLKEDHSKVEETNAYYSPSTHYSVSDTASKLASYYSSIDDSYTGTSLLSKLQTLNSNKRHQTVGYGTMGTDTSGAFIYTDYDLNSTATDSNGQIYGTRVASFYTKTSATGWNREHMWPNSHGGNNVESDILHTRPTISSENSNRGNSFYVEGKCSQSAGWDPKTAGYSEYCRGECARVILYCIVAYPSFTLSDAESHSTSNSNKDNMMGQMSTLIKWHFNYLPNVYEMNRNNGAEYLQGNRNPFVDHPEYVARIWSNFNSTVTSLCNQNSSTYSNWNAGSYCNYGSNTPSHSLEGVTISASTAKVINGSTTTLSATASNNGTISWTTSNSSVASISSSSSASGANITITGNSTGTATITARCTINGTTYSPTCTVTVLASKQVSSIAVSGQKTKFSIGDTFSFGGTVTATYNDDTEEDVTSSASFSGYDLTSTGEQTVTVSYTYGVSASTTYKITVSSGSSGSTDYELYSGSITEGNYLIVYSNKAMKNTVSSDRLGYTEVSPSNNVISNPDASLIWHIEQSGSYWTIYNESVNKYAASTGAKNKAQLLGSGSDNKSLWSVSGTSTYEFVNKQNSSSGVNANLRENGTYGYACYSTDTGGALSLYKQGSTTPVTLSSITVSTAPTKTTYTAGEYFDPTGLIITRTYSDSTSNTYTYANHISDFTFTPSTSTTLSTGNTSVTITYDGKSCSLPITVNAAKTLSSIAVSTAPTKTTYTAGEYFDPTGLVITRNYSDSTSDTYTYANHTGDFTFSPTTSTALTTSNASVTITYGGKSTSQAITVNAVKTLSSISVSTAPTKTTYTAGEYFDPTGLVITRTYSDSTSDTYTYDNHTSEFSFTPSTSTALTTQHTSVTITYSGKSTSQAITVNSSGGGSSETGWVETSITELTSSDVFVIVGNNGSNYAMSNNNGTSSAPSAVGVTVSNGKITSEVAESLKWNVSVSNSRYTFYPNGSTSTWLFCTDTNNGVRVGTTTSNKFVLDSTGYLKSATLTRYIGIYNSQDWRCYGSTGGNISGQTFAFYKYVSGSTPEPGTPSLTWTAPTIDVFSGTTLTADSYTSWGVTYNDGNGNTTYPSLNNVAVKLGSATITLPYTWSGDDNGKSLSVEYNSKSTSSTTVTVTQTINNVMADMPSVSTKTWTVASGDLGTTIASVNGTASGTLTFDDASTMSYLRTLQYVASGKSDHIGMNGTYMQFGSSNALEKLELTATTSGTVTSVVVDCWAKDGGSNVYVTVGGNAFDSTKTCPSSGANVTFTGSASGNVVITMQKSSKTSGLAQYIKSVSITTEGSSGSTIDIANSASHKAAQRVAVNFAKAFNTAMDTTGYCTANMSSAWSTCSNAYDTFKTEAAALGSTEEAYAKNLIKYATVQWSDDSGEACIERMMKTYEVCVTKHGQTAFMNDLFTVNTSLVNTISTIQENALLMTLVIIVSAIGISSIAGYFFIKKRKEI